MCVFVTGGTGTIGSAVIPELLGNGHAVLALAHSDQSARALDDAGATVVRGGLADLSVLQSGATHCDGVIHLAFGRDYGSPDALAQGITEESAALQTLGEALIGSDRPIVVASGTPWVPGRIAVEADPLPTDGPVAGRARFSGVAGYPGDGAQRWPAVHAIDAAVLFRLALDSAPGGTAWHAVADEGDAVRDLATVIGRRLSLPVREVPQETFGPLGPIFAIDQPTSSAHTREVLGWRPVHPGLLADLENIQL